MVSNTLIFLDFLCREQPPPRGCVLKPSYTGMEWAGIYRSRLRAAVC